MPRLATSQLLIFGFPPFPADSQTLYRTLPVASSATSHPTPAHSPPKYWLLPHSSSSSRGHASQIARSTTRNAKSGNPAAFPTTGQRPDGGPPSAQPAEPRPRSAAWPVSPSNRPDSVAVRLTEQTDTPVVQNVRGTGLDHGEFSRPSLPGVPRPALGSPGFPRPPWTGHRVDSQQTVVAICVRDDIPHSGSSSLATPVRPPKTTAVSSPDSGATVGPRCGMIHSSGRTASPHLARRGPDWSSDWIARGGMSCQRDSRRFIQRVAVSGLACVWGPHTTDRHRLDRHRTSDCPPPRALPSLAAVGGIPRTGRPPGTLKTPVRTGYTRRGPPMLASPQQRLSSDFVEFAP